MTFKEGLLKARSRIVFISVLLLSFPLITYLERVGYVPGQAASLTERQTKALIETQPTVPLSASEILRPDEVEWARIAWRYYENNIVPATGLANSANQYYSTTMWDTGSFLLAVIAANKIGIVKDEQFKLIILQALTSLERLPLFDDVLPNKAYNTLTLKMVDYDNNPTEIGMGWSALDIARLLVPLTILKGYGDDYRFQINRILAKWHIGQMLQDGKLVGAARGADGAVQRYQEGRIGYEEYAAKAMIFSGFDAYEAWRTDDYIVYHDVLGIKVPSDIREAKTHGAQVYVTSEPYILDGLEFGFDTRSRAFSELIYLAQAKRYEVTGKLTAVSEGHINRKPSFVYSTVFGGGEPWAVLSESGNRFDDLRTLNTKAVFAYDALYGTPYTKQMLARAVKLNKVQGGWFEGVYEINGQTNDIETANTNGVILESIAYRLGGFLTHSEP